MVWDRMKSEVLDFEYDYSVFHQEDGALSRLRDLTLSCATSGNAHEQFFTQINYALMLFSAGQFPQALHVFENIKQEAAAVNLEPRLPVLLQRWFGRTLQKVGRLDQAERELEAVLKFFNLHSHYEHDLAVSYSDLAWIYHDRVREDGAYVDRAVHMITRAIDLREADGSFEAKRILMEEYYAYGCFCVLRDNMMELGLEMFRKSHNLAKEAFRDQPPPPMAMSRVHRGLGLGYAKQGKWTESVSSLKEAIAFRMLGGGSDHAQVGNLQFLLSQVYAMMGDETNMAACRAEAERIWSLNQVPLHHAWRHFPHELRPAGLL